MDTRGGMIVKHIANVCWATLVGWLVGWLANRWSNAVRSNPHTCCSCNLLRLGPFPYTLLPNRISRPSLHVITSQALKVSRGPWVTRSRPRQSHVSITASLSTGEPRTDGHQRPPHQSLDTLESHVSITASHSTCEIEIKHYHRTLPSTHAHCEPYSLLPIVPLSPPRGVDLVPVCRPLRWFLEYTCVKVFVTFTKSKVASRQIRIYLRGGRILEGKGGQGGKEGQRNFLLW